MNASIILAAVLAVFSSITAPLVLVVVTERSRRAEKQQDYAREDAKAARAEEVARAAAVTAAQAAADARQIQQRQDEQAADARRAADLLAATNAKVEQAAEVTNGKLDVIHVLVNSQMTAAMQSELDAVTRELAMMREVIALNRAAGREPTPEAAAAVEATKAKLAELAAALADRHRAGEEAARQERDEPGPGKGAR